MACVERKKPRCVLIPRILTNASSRIGLTRAYALTQVHREIFSA